MDVLVTIRYVAEIVFVLLFIVFVIYAIKAFKKISTSVENIENEAKQTINDITPVVKEVSAVVADIKDVTGKSRQQYYKIETTVDALVERVNEVNNILGVAGSKARTAIDESSNLITAVSRGVKAFKNKLTQ